MNIHPSAIVSPEAQIGQNVVIGPLAVIESDVVIGDRCQIAAHVVIKNGTRLGPDNEICEAAVLGGLPQHVHKPEHPGLLMLGCGNTIREQVTLHRAMKEGSATALGDHNFLMANAHVGHDCRLGNHIVMANAAVLAGHVSVDDRAFISAGVGVHQFCRVGRLAMIGGHAGISQRRSPVVMIDTYGPSVVGLNIVGLRRSGHTTGRNQPAKGRLPDNLSPRTAVERRAGATPGNFHQRPGGIVQRIFPRRQTRLRARTAHAARRDDQNPPDGRRRCAGRK